MDDETIDETTDEPTTDEQTDDGATEEVASSIDLPLDNVGKPIHVGDYVIVRGRRDICTIVSMTTDGGDDNNVGADGLKGWMLHVKSVTQQNAMNYRSRDLRVLELTPEETLLIEFFDEASSSDVLEFQLCKDYAQRITVNE